MRVQTPTKAYRGRPKTGANRTGLGDGGVHHRGYNGGRVKHSREPGAAQIGASKGFLVSNIQIMEMTFKVCCRIITWVEYSWHILSKSRCGPARSLRKASAGSNDISPGVHGRGGHGGASRAPARPTGEELWPKRWKLAPRARAPRSAGHVTCAARPWVNPWPTPVNVSPERGDPRAQAPPEPYPCLTLPLTLSLTLSLTPNTKPIPCRVQVLPRSAPPRARPARP